MSAGPRVGVNLLWLVPGVVGGSEEYTVRLLHALADQLDDRLDVVLYVNRRFPAAHAGLVARFATVVAPIDGHPKVVRVAAESTWLARQARRDGLGLLHHMGGILPLVQTVPSVLTLHDLQPLAMPEHFARTKQAFHRAVLPWSVRTAARITTLTEFTRQDLGRRLGVDPAKVEIVRPGVEEVRDLTPAMVAEVLERYGLAGRPYFLYPAITYPHKNHRVLIDAFARLRAVQPEARLVLTSRPDQHEQALADQAARLGVLEAVVRTGRIPVHDLDALYRGATALTFASRFEGFGLPVLEAMVRGCPVLAARATALPEVVGSAGILLAPDDPQEWAQAMESMITDPQRRQALVDAGRRWAASFSWTDAAGTLERVWWEVLA